MKKQNGIMGHKNPIWQLALILVFNFYFIIIFFKHLIEDEPQNEKSTWN